MSLLTNGGKIDISTICKINGLDQPVWFNKDYTTNVLSLGLLSEKYHITYDSKQKSDAFIVHRPGIRNSDSQKNLLDYFQYIFLKL